MFYEDSICIMMQQPTITTISRWPVVPLPLLYSPGTCTHCRTPLLLPVSSTAATISPPTLLSHIDLWIMKSRQLGRIGCLVGGYSTHVKHHVRQQVHLPQFLGVCIYKKWVRKKGTVQKCANSQDFLVIRMNLYGPYHVLSKMDPKDDIFCIMRFDQKTCSTPMT